MAAEATSSEPTVLPTADKLWVIIRTQSEQVAAAEPQLRRALHNRIWQYKDFASAVAARVARFVADEDMEKATIQNAAQEAYAAAPTIVDEAIADLDAIVRRDPANIRDYQPDHGTYLRPFLYYKGFYAIQSHRISHWLWSHGREYLAMYMQHNISAHLQIDIHPQVPIGEGLFIDHAASVVIGQTARIGKRVSILQNVTLGGTGVEQGDRHPIVEDDVLLSPGAEAIGRITLGKGCHIGPGSVAVLDVDPYTAVSGPLARAVVRNLDSVPELMKHVWVRVGGQSDAA
jgi:serine O-acetyltransferase